MARGKKLSAGEVVPEKEDNEDELLSEEGVDEDG